MVNTQTSRIGLALIAALGTAACSGEDSTCLDAEGAIVCNADDIDDVEGERTTTDAAPLLERLRELDSDLGIGSRGPEVRAVHDYLTAFGYFPNPDLAERYPTWRPLVSEPPADPEEYDEQTAAAVRALQEMSRVDATGEVDEATRTVLRMDRCGVPEGMGHSDSHEKFAHFPGWTPGVAVSYSRSTRLLSHSNVNISAAQFRHEIEQALNPWHLATELDFVYDSSGNGNIRVAFFADGETDLSGNVVDFDDAAGNATPPGGGAGGDIRLNVAKKWSLSNSPPENSVDLRAVILHELGHANGLHHSSAGPAIMNPFWVPNIQDRALYVDDKVGISHLYDQWVVVPGSARQIDVGGNGDVWILGASLVNGGYRAYKRVGSNWVAASSSQTGQRIAVDQSGRPWLVKANGQSTNNIYRLSSSDPGSGTWSQVNGCATDIDVGADGSVWIVACSGDRLRKRVGSSWVAMPGTDAVSRVAVDENGIPWTIATGIVSRLSTSDPNTAGWVFVPSVPGQAADIDVGPGFQDSDLPNTNYGAFPFALSAGATKHLYLYNQQVGSSTTPSKNQWLLVDGQGISVGVAPDGQPWLVGADFSIRRRTK